LHIAKYHRPIERENIMSPVAELIAMQARLAKHNREVEKRWQAYLNDPGETPEQREYADMLQIEYDERFMKVDGREG
jgi:chemotaxis regulatin CheY-phosphate phosphatase CheZ